MATQKQIQANKINSQKAGVKTRQGKEIVKYNALKHGLLAKEIVIKKGDGAENQVEFDLLLDGLNNHYKPVGSIEEILVEKIAVSYWRMKRASRYEVGLIRQELDTYQSDFLKEPVRNLFETPSFTNKREKKSLGEVISKIKKIENDAQQSIDDENELALLKMELKEIEFQIDRVPHVNAIPTETNLNNLMRYETAIERQFYKAISELERIQRMRDGDTVIPPINLDVNVV